MSTIYVDFVFVDFDKILDNFINFCGILWGCYFLPTLPSRYGIGGACGCELACVIPRMYSLRCMMGVVWAGDSWHSLSIIYADEKNA